MLPATRSTGTTVAVGAFEATTRWRAAIDSRNCRKNLAFKKFEEKIQRKRAREPFGHAP
jgi:hypothetical protein